MGDTPAVRKKLALPQHYEVLLRMLYFVINIECLGYPQSISGRSPLKAMTDATNIS